MRFWVAALISILLVTPAHARWLQAESEHFVIYAEDSEKDLQHFAEMLERYHAALERLTGNRMETPSPSNRITIFVLGSERAVRKAHGTGDRFVAGFYRPRAGASRAFVPRLRRSSGEPDISQTVLLHEYAHHFLISTSRFAMPRWLGEGLAEFFASTKLLGDGSLQIGRAANHRAFELSSAIQVPIRELLDPELYEQNRGRGYDSFYGRSWTLVHYLWFTDERRGQLNAYWQAVAEGTPSLQAAEKVFGDLDALDNDIDAYIRQRKILAYKLAPELLPIGPVRVYGVSDGLDAMLPVIAHSQSGVTREEALDLLPDARKIAARYPDDARVLGGLAEAEVDAGYYDEAVAVADRAIAIDGTVANAHLQKGLALFRKAGDATDQDAAYRDAILAFAGLNKLENDNPLPLIYLYRSYVDRGLAPSEHAQHALIRATELAPFDQDLSMELAIMFAQTGAIANARATFAPVAANPHGGPRAEIARRSLGELIAAEEGKPFRLSFLDQQPADAADAIEEPQAGTE